MSVGKDRTMSAQDVQDWIVKQVAGNDVELFMKGTKAMPQCGFSMQVAQILQHLGVDFKDINVLEDMSVREGVKAYSNWPTIPQLYVKGEFIGGGGHVGGKVSGGGAAGSPTGKSGAPHK